MIDTVKFKISVSHEDFCDCLSMRINSNETKLDDGSYVVRNCQFPVTIPSFDRNVNILLYPKVSPDHIFIEFSVPKQLFGTNIIVPTREAIINAVEAVKCVLKGKIKGLPDTREWLVQRLDLSVMWNYGSLEKATKVLNVLKNFGDRVYDTSVYQGYNSTFYLKYPEFIKHDYKFVRQKDLERAERLSDLCRGYLRFEVRLREKMVYNRLGYYDWFNICRQDDSVFKNAVIGALRGFLNGNEIKYMTPYEAYKILIEKYGVPTATKLIGYMAIRDGNLFGKADLLKNYSHNHRSRYNRLLKMARIGVNAKTKIDFPDMNSNILVLPGVMA